MLWVPLQKSVRFVMHRCKEQKQMLLVQQVPLKQHGYDGNRQCQTIYPKTLLWQLQERANICLQPSSRLASQISWYLQMTIIWYLHTVCRGNWNPKSAQEVFSDNTAHAAQSGYKDQTFCWKAAETHFKWGKIMKHTVKLPSYIMLPAAKNASIHLMLSVASRAACYVTNTSFDQRFYPVDSSTVYAFRAPDYFLCSQATANANHSHCGRRLWKKLLQVLCIQTAEQPVHTGIIKSHHQSGKQVKQIISFQHCDRRQTF